MTENVNFTFRLTQPVDFADIPRIESICIDFDLFLVRNMEYHLKNIKIKFCLYVRRVKICVQHGQDTARRGCMCMCLNVSACSTVNMFNQKDLQNSSTSI